MIQQYWAPFLTEKQILFYYLNMFKRELPEVSNVEEAVKLRRRTEKRINYITSQGLRIQFAGLVNFHMGEGYRTGAFMQSGLLIKVFGEKPFYQKEWPENE